MIRCCQGREEGGTGRTKASKSMKGKIYRCKYTGIVGSCTQTSDHGNVFSIRTKGTIYIRTKNELQPLKPQEIDAAIKASIWSAGSGWGDLEKLAGVKDRQAFWKNKTEPQASVELRRLICERFMRGDI